MWNCSNLINIINLIVKYLDRFMFIIVSMLYPIKNCNKTAKRITKYSYKMDL